LKAIYTKEKEKEGKRPGDTDAASDLQGFNYEELTMGLTL
jgi:hypothetical protein